MADQEWRYAADAVVGEARLAGAPVEKKTDKFIYLKNTGGPFDYRNRFEDAKTFKAPSDAIKAALKAKFREQERIEQEIMGLKALLEEGDEALISKTQAAWKRRNE